MKMKNDRNSEFSPAVPALVCSFWAEKQPVVLSLLHRFPGQRDEPTQQPAVVTKVDPQPLGDGLQCDFLSKSGNGGLAFNSKSVF